VPSGDPLDRSYELWGGGGGRRWEEVGGGGERMGWDGKGRGAGNRVREKNAKQ
jgi:hypothetical protein